MTRLSCIIPIYNALDDVKILFKSILKNFNFNIGEVIIVNDCSNQDTTNFLRDFSQRNNEFIYHENEENLGFVQTCNKGISIAKGDIVVLLNSDTIIPKEFCERIIKCFNSDNKIGIASPIGASSVTYYIPLPQNLTLEEMNHRLREKHQCSYPLIPNAEGFCYCIRKDVIEQQGYLDTIWGKGYHEEVDYAYKAITNGWTNVLIDDLYVFHKAEASFGKKNRSQQISKNDPEFKKRWNGFKEKYIIENNLDNPMLKIDKELNIPYIDRELQRTPLQYIFSIKKTKTKKTKIITIFGLQWKISKKSPMKFLVHLHLYYLDQLDFIIDKLKNIQGCKWDLVVTINEENCESINKILKFKPNTKIIKVKNIGYDIYPFLEILRKIDIKNYDYILKIHTKNINKDYSIEDFRYNGPHFKNEFWRDELIRPLISTKKHFAKNLNLLSNNPDIGMIVSKTFLMNLRSYVAEETYLLDKLKERLDVTSSYNKFLAGTMFIIKADILKTLIESDLKEDDFIIDENTYTSGNEGQFVHAVERIFTILTDEAGYRIYAVPNIKMEIYGFFRCLIKNIFSLENSRDKTHKILTILGFKIKFQRKLKSK